MSRRAALFIALAFAAAPAAAAEIGDFYGAYVGEAHVLGLEDSGQAPEIRDIDVLIEAHDDGFTISSITVNHHGSRMDPDVRRRESVMSFGASDIDGVYRRVFEVDMFRRRQNASPAAGDPVRWARVDGDSLITYSFAINDDGGYTLHLFRRTLNDTGLDLWFASIRDGEITRRVDGRLVRVENEIADISP